MALYEVTLRQRYYQQNVINVFSYQATSGIGLAPNALELLTLMGFIASGDPLEFPADTIASLLQSVQPAAVEFMSVEARELYSVADFYEAIYNPPIEGTWASVNTLSPISAYGFVSSRVRLDVRRGTKRFVGVAEDANDPGGNISVAMLGFLADVAAAMSEVLAGALSTYHPAVIPRERVVDGVTGKVTYRLYEDPSVQEDLTAVDVVWSPYSTVRSQVSRQYGHGS